MARLEAFKGLDINSVGPVRSFVAIDYSGGDQTVATGQRGIYIGTAGNLVVRGIGDDADTTIVGLAAGSTYTFVFSYIRQTGSTAAGLLLF